ncbi:MAG: hypothetical protein L6263_13650 [Desulfobacteraceae bacterium]|nr:hypothetical protein [Pseudomonadota bacterium]MBU4260076.1 hypothetical protein [Pseudomonadota bacterium]MCG2759458.1 hypothetical protein [Desulfobacteraceae bacterium]
MLPAAAAAFIGVQLIIGVVNSLVPLPEKIINIFCQFTNSIAGPFAFVIVGARIAPTFKYYVSIFLTVVYAIFSAILVHLSIKSQDFADPLWWLITSVILGLFAAIFACSFIKAEETKKYSNEFTE